MIRSVLKKGNPLLHEVSRPVTDIPEAGRLIGDMWDTLTAIRGLYRFTRGSGLSASQIGELWRVSTIVFDDELYTLVNPEIVAHSPDKVSVSEGCLSFFDYRGRALRWADVTVQAVDRSGKPFELSSNGDLDLSSLLQHELDHHDGILFDSRLAEGEELTFRPGLPRIP